MSLLREVKPRNARTARIVKSREPQLLESRKRILLLHGSKCPPALRKVLSTLKTLTSPSNVQLHKKNADIHPFEDPSSLEFLAQKNECALVAFGTSSKKRPNCLSLLRIYNDKMLDMVELLLLNSEADMEQENGKLSVGVEMKPLIIFAGSQWDDNSASENATLFRQLKSMFLDLFQGEEIASVDVAGLSYVLMIAAPETGAQGSNGVNGTSTDPNSKPVLRLRWYKIRTLRSNTPKVPRVELEQIGSSIDFRVGRYKLADSDVLKDAMKHGRRPAEARVKKNIETDLMGDQLGRVHLGKQDLRELQTRKMKGLKRGRDEVDEETRVDGANGGLEEEDDVVSEDEDDDEVGGMEIGSEDEDEVDGSSEGGTGDEIDIGESDEEADQMPKRQKLR